MIRKQEFYEGAALRLLLRAGATMSVRYASPFFLIDARLRAYLKFSTKGRSPWGFKFARDEQSLIHASESDVPLVLGLVCGSDGVVALPFKAYRTIAAPSVSAVHIACYRQHGEHYAVSGPDGDLHHKIPPSNWSRLLDN